MEWKDVLIESLKGAVILALLERLYITRNGSWFEDHIGVFVRSAFVRGRTLPGSCVLRLTAAARRLLLHSKPAIQPCDIERLPAVAPVVEAHKAHQRLM